MDFCISYRWVNILDPSKLFSVPKHHKEVCQAKDVGLWLESLIEHLCHNFCHNLTTRTMQKVGNPPLQKIIILDESLENLYIWLKSIKKGANCLWGTIPWFALKTCFILRQFIFELISPKETSRMKNKIKRVLKLGY